MMSNGKSYNNQYHFLLFVRDGKVSKVMEYLDNQLADAVLGPYLAGNDSTPADALPDHST